jgi:hypothetical protein
LITFTTTLQKFDKQGEKTGWTYLTISSAQAKKLKPATKVSFRVKGTIDNHRIRQVALLPMGEGNFIMPINNAMRKILGKRQGEKVTVSLAADNDPFAFNAELIACLKDEPAAYLYFKKLSGSHQKYFSKWIDAAKTTATKAKRIVMAVTALSQQRGYAEMIRMNKGKP